MLIGLPEGTAICSVRPKKLGMDEALGKTEGFEDYPPRVSRIVLGESSRPELPAGEIGDAIQSAQQTVRVDGAPSIPAVATDASG